MKIRPNQNLAQRDEISDGGVCKRIQSRNSKDIDAKYADRNIEYQIIKSNNSYIKKYMSELTTHSFDIYSKVY